MVPHNYLFQFHYFYIFMQKSYESMIHQYKKKIGKNFFNLIYTFEHFVSFVEDVQEMKKQLKAMNDKNMTYMQQNLDLEEVWSLVM